MICFYVMAKDANTDMNPRSPIKCEKLEQFHVDTDADTDADMEVWSSSFRDTKHFFFSIRSAAHGEI